MSELAVEELDNGTTRVQILQSKDIEYTFGLVRDLRALRPESKVIFDFGAVNFTPPSWLVLVGGALRSFKKEQVSVKRNAANYKHLRYAAHMGFFDHFGLNFGLAQGEAPGSTTYVPLSERTTADVRRLAALGGIPVGEEVHEEAERLASILTQSKHGDLQDTLAYSIREIIRNVVEHSGAESYVFSAQYWPTMNQVEVVVADHGIGLARSLSENPNLTIVSERDALRQSVLPGVSSKNWRKANPYDDWANSGYGLFMTERLCRSGGLLALASGGECLLSSEAGTKFIATDWPGTVAILRLKTESLGKLNSRLAQFREEGLTIEREQKRLSSGPSRASQSSKPRSWKGES